MKKRTEKRDNTVPDKMPQNPEASAGDQKPAKLSGTKLFVFRIILIFLPVLLFLIVEVGLRIGNVGYPTSFLREIVKDGKKYYVENKYFGYRFFPSKLARVPEPLICLAEKPAGVYRIIVFGESAALGDPAPAYSFARMLETILNEQITGIRFEVLNVSMTAINSHVIHDIAKDCMKLNADLWLLYIGNNEVIGPFGPATVFTVKNLPYPVIRFIVNIKKLRTVQVIQSALEKLTSGKFGFREWAGMEMFMNSQIRFQDKVLDNVHSNFRRNLTQIIKSGMDSGADVLLTTPVANYRDNAPFGSLHKPGLSEEDLKKWNEYLESGKKLEGEKRYAEALTYYKKAEAIDDTYAELMFHIARCLEKTAVDEKDANLAHNYYRRAVDYDTMRFRPDTAIIEDIKSVAESFKAASSNRRSGSTFRFIDSLPALGRFGIRNPGNDILWEHVHLNFRGNYFLSLILADEVVDILKSRASAGGLQFSVRTNRVDETQLYVKIGLTDYDRLKVCKEMEKRLGLPPFTYRSNHAEEVQRLKSEIESLEKITRTAGIKKYIDEYEKLIEQRPDDFVIHQRYGELLDENGIYDKALEQWQFVKSLIPHYPVAYLQIGNLLDKMGRSSEAIPYFEIALKMNPQSAEAYSSLGLCLLNLNRYDEALVAFKKALELKPDFPAIYVNMSLVYSAKGDMEAAKQQCMNAIRISTNYGAAYLNLGKYYALEGNQELALSNYLKVVEIDNKNAIAYYNVANVLSRLGRKQEALTNYMKAVELNPDFGEAHLNLAFELLDFNDNQSALKHFQTAARLLTNNVIAQINCGIAYARAGRFNEAALYFEKALQLDPHDPQVHYNLGLLYVKMGQRDKAVIELSRTLDLDPNHREAKALLEKITPKL